MFKWNKIANNIHYRIILKLYGSRLVIGQYIVISKDIDDNTKLIYQRYLGIDEKFIVNNNNYNYIKKIYDFLKPHIHKETIIIGEENIINSKFIKYKIVYENLPTYLRDKKLEKLLK